jgi:hypothetical protein
MKRKSSIAATLVYAYRCGEPLAGLDLAEREDERMRDLWDRLVDIERMWEAEQRQAAARHITRAAEIVQRLREITGALPAARNDAVKALLVERAQLRRELWPLLAQWRAAHKDEMKAIEEARYARVTEARQLSTAYWGNYLNVIQRYETARVEVLKKGRRLRKSSLDDDSGRINVQIQRTPSGLGAAPSELQDGTVSDIAIGVVPEAAHTSGFRGERRELCRTVVELRCDAAGGRIKLPLVYHRPLPPNGRVKWCQLTWRKRGEKTIWQLCLTVTLNSATVTIDTVLDRGALRVARIAGPGGLAERVELSRDWMHQYDRVDHLASIIRDEQAPARLRINARLQRPGLWVRLLARRREQYRLLAIDLCRRSGGIVVVSPPLSEQAWRDEGSAQNGLRQRACAHQLIAELRHQCEKRAVAFEEVLAEPESAEAAASAPVPRRVRRRKINGMERAAAKTMQPLAAAAESA